MGMPELRESRPGFTPKPFIKADGPRILYVQQVVDVEDVSHADAHQELMGEFAARAVRWFGEQMLEIQWHTLRFEVVRSGMESDGYEQHWRWSVWAS